MSINICGFTKIYKNSPAVLDFSMECQKGQITGILGPNGAGKTTILKAVTARHFPTAGKIFVSGIDTEENPELIKQKTGFVEEIPDLNEDLTVLEFLKFKARIWNLPEEKITSSIEKVLHQCDLEEWKNLLIKNLSKGTKERVNIAQCLVYDPEVIVLDEPASGLDPAQIINMRKLVKELAKDHTILLSTHLMQEVEALCDKVYIICHGKKMAEGSISQILEQTESENLEEAFFKLTK